MAIIVVAIILSVKLITLRLHHLFGHHTVGDHSIASHKPELITLTMCAKNKYVALKKYKTPKSYATYDKYQKRKTLTMSL